MNKLLNILMLVWSIVFVYYIYFYSQNYENSVETVYETTEISEDKEVEKVVDSPNEKEEPFDMYKAWHSQEWEKVKIELYDGKRLDAEVCMWKGVVHKYRIEPTDTCGTQFETYGNYVFLLNPTKEGKDMKAYIYYINADRPFRLTLDTYFKENSYFTTFEYDFLDKLGINLNGI